jgi:hypothetical protein
MNPYLQIVKFKALNKEWIYSSEGLVGQNGKDKKLLVSLIKRYKMTHVPLNEVIEDALNSFEIPFEIISVDNEEDILPDLDSDEYEF